MSRAGFSASANMLSSGCQQRKDSKDCKESEAKGIQLVTNIFSKKDHVAYGMGLLAFAKKHWFLIGIVFFISLARVAPWIGRKDGPMYPEITIKYIAVSVIFLISGLSLKSEDLQSAIFHYKLHLFIQGFTFIVIPVVLIGLVQILYLFGTSDHLLQGVVLVSCLPPPVSSAVIITKAIGGNEAGAVFNSAFGSFLGVFVTPMLLLFLGLSGPVSVSQIILALSLTVVVPLGFGRILRVYLRNWMSRRNPPLGVIGSFMLLLITFTAFCDSFESEAGVVRVNDLLLIVVLILAIQICFLLSIFYIANRVMATFSPEDTVALMFCATHKSLTLGLPLINIIYAGDPLLPLVSIPLLIYHPMQILLGGFLVPYMKVWLDDVRAKRKVFKNGLGEHV